MTMGQSKLQASAGFAGWRFMIWELVDGPSRYRKVQPLTVGRTHFSKSFAEFSVHQESICPLYHCACSSELRSIRLNTPRLCRFAVF